MTDAQRITLAAALRLLLEKHEHVIQERERATWTQSLRAEDLQRAQTKLARAQWTFDAAVDQFVEVLDKSLTVENANAA